MFFRTWDVSFVNYCGIPFLVRTYDDIYGTGVGVEATDWLNLRTGSIPLCYSPRTLEMSSWSPMGWWDFQGALSEATIQEDDLGFTITMEATSRLYRMIDMEIRSLQGRNTTGPARTPSRSVMTPKPTPPISWRGRAAGSTGAPAPIHSPIASISSPFKTS